MSHCCWHGGVGYDGWEAGYGGWEAGYDGWEAGYGGWEVGYDGWEVGTDGSAAVVGHADWAQFQTRMTPQ